MYSNFHPPPKIETPRHPTQHKMPLIPTNMQMRLYNFLESDVTRAFEDADSEYITEVKYYLSSPMKFQTFAHIIFSVMMESPDFRGISPDVQQELWEDICERDGYGLQFMYAYLNTEVKKLEEAR